MLINNILPMFCHKSGASNAPLRPSKKSFYRKQNLKICRVWRFSTNRKQRKIYIALIPNVYRKHWGLLAF